MPMRSPLLAPPGSRPIFMLRTMMLPDEPLMRMPKFADERFRPRMLMSFLPLIDSSCAGLLH